MECSCAVVFQTLRSTLALCSVDLTLWAQRVDNAGSAACTNCPVNTFTWVFMQFNDGSWAETWAGSPGVSPTPRYGNSVLTACKCNSGYYGPDGEACQSCPVGTYKDSPGMCKAMVICNLLLINSTRRLSTSAYCRQSNVYRLSRKFYNHLDSDNWS